MSDTSEDDVREMRKSSASDRLPSGSHTFSIDDFVFPIEELKMGEVIAAGSFGSVCHGTYKGLDVAVKRQRIEGKSVTDEKYLLSELAILRSLDHPRLLRYIGCALIHDPVVPGGDALDEDGQPRPNVVVTVTNVMPRGDLHMFLQAEKAACAKTTARGTDVKRASYESWRVKARMLHSACEGIAHLHERQLIHRDIKGHNLLLAEDDTLVVCDFGFCRKIASEAKRARRNHRHTLLGTPDYMAPELTLGEKYDEKADVYSFGMILLEIATNCVAGETGTCLERKPRDCFDLNFDAIRKKANAKLGRSGTLALPPPQSLVELAIQCCAYDPEERPSAEDAMEWLEELIEELASAVRVPTFSFPSLLLLSFFPSRQLGERFAFSSSFVAPLSFLLVTSPHSPPPPPPPLQSVEEFLDAHADDTPQGANPSPPSGEARKRLSTLMDLDELEEDEEEEESDDDESDAPMEEVEEEEEETAAATAAAAAEAVTNEKKEVVHDIVAEAEAAAAAAAAIEKETSAAAPPAPVPLAEAGAAASEEAGAPAAAAAASSSSSSSSSSSLPATAAAAATNAGAVGAESSSAALLSQAMAEMKERDALASLSAARDETRRDEPLDDYARTLDVKPSKKKCIVS